MYNISNIFQTIKVFEFRCIYYTQRVSVSSFSYGTMKVEGVKADVAPAETQLGRGKKTQHLSNLSALGGQKDRNASIRNTPFDSNRVPSDRCP